VSLARLGRLLMRLSAQLFYRHRANRLVLVAVLLCRLVLFLVAASTILHTNK
jgi:hypothetical protein